MKKHPPITFRQLILGIAFLLAFSGMVIFLFSYRRDEKRFTDITTQLFAGEMKSNTLSMHYTLANPAAFGLGDYEPVLSCYDREASLRGQAQTENTLAALNALHPENLSEPDAYLWRLLTRTLENALALSSFRYYEEPLSPTSGTQSNLPILLAEYPFRNKRDVEDYLALLDQTDAYFASLLTYEQEKAAAGYIMPSSFLKEVRKQCDTIVTKEALEEGTHFLQLTFQERLDTLLSQNLITDKEASAYIAQNERLLKTVLLPAYIALGDGLLLLEDPTKQPAGLASMPKGKSYYEQLLISETGSYRPVSEIREMLVEQFSKEYDEIRTLAQTHPELRDSLLKDTTKDFPYKNASQMLQDLQNRMKKDFPALPGSTASIAVKAVSDSLEPYSAPAFYLTAPLDDTDQNSIYINRAKTPDGLELYTTLAHEGYPGHMYQTIYHNRSALAAGERPARELLWYGGYQEGWAVYVEFLAYDYAAQLLSEDGQEAAALTARLEAHNRSLQLCLYSLMDIMIHYENASSDQIAKMLEKFGIRDADSATSLYQYIVQSPCNYLKYYLGYLEILSLQETAKNLWGADYTDYRFHCFYLDCGPSDFLSLAERLASWDSIPDKPEQPNNAHETHADSSSAETGATTLPLTRNAAPPHRPASSTISSR